ncbi:MAG: dicarboxylate/amino acid:cation symporter, partial [Rickettsiaceae bacterium]|nr:dicarboxylate/amino acid:cation symporter [Rickettsiaceae bacterium]
GRIGVKSTAIFLMTTCFAVIFGIGVAHFMEPGKGLVMDFGFTNSGPKAFDLPAFFLNIIPSNAVAALAGENVLQVVFFAIFTGLAINKMGSSASSIKGFFQAMSKVVLKMISMIITLSPYGAFALTAWVVGAQGVDILFSLSKLVGAMVIAMGLQYLIFGVLILVFCNISPIPFYKKSLEYQVIAISTGSSKASLSTTMKVCKEDLGISDTSTSFVLPLGASINMDGTAIKLGLAALFVAQIMNVDLKMMDYVIMILTATLGSIGAAGIPGAFMVMLPMVLSSVNLPIEGVALFAGIDRLLDLLSTTINITGDATITLIVDNSEGTLDKDRYYSE